MNGQNNERGKTSLKLHDYGGIGCEGLGMLALNFVLICWGALTNNVAFIIIL